MRECDVGRALANHEVDGDEALEDDGPRCIPEAVLQRADDLCDTRLARVRRDEEVLDVLCLWGRILVLWLASRTVLGVGPRRSRTLILVAPLTDFSKELDMM